jgi:hypothetical protein
VDQNGQKATDRLTFYKNSNVISEVFANDSVISKVAGKYNLDRKTKLLELEIENKSVKFKIEKLNDAELFLLDENSNKTVRMLRTQ